jgi:hypothetical protein
MVGVLHPWTQALADHPHVHSLVPGGALAPDGGQWLSPRSADWLVPVHALSALFQGKCKAALTTAGLLTPVPPQVWTKGWVTPCQPAGTGTEVLTYRAPSIRRIAITNHRLETLEDGHVTFRVTERTSHTWTSRTLPAEACMRRFLPHVLPKGCVQVRSYGVLSPRRRPALAQTDLPPSVFGYLLSNQLVKLFQTLWCRHVICPFYSCISPYLTIKWLNLPSSYLPMFSASYDVGRRDPTNFLLSD